ncbi:MAG TPA: glycine dehydrogenase subunit 2 [Anaerolineae bacterium]|nr:glycine dehydrogenase subunit 2 [Anaerolineae bacterium]
MPPSLPPEPRRFHQARWDEPIIFELSKPGLRGILPPRPEPGVLQAAGDPQARIPASLRRARPPALPKLTQPQVLRHYLRLSQETLGADLIIDAGQGTCTMKYSPKINEKLARSPDFAELHPLQDEETVQGILEIMARFEDILKAISGMDRFSLQPQSGSAGIYANAAIVRAYHADRGESHRDEIITTLFSHPSDAAAAVAAGYKAIILYPDPETGYPSVDALKAAVSERTAALFITNPEDTGIFNPHIAEFTRIVHEAGGLCVYDQANANGILGVTRAREAGFDLCHFNLHKTFSSPHGSGGPGAGAIGVTEKLAPYLPVPLVDFDGERYFLNFDRPKSIGKVAMWYGNVGVVLRAFAWAMRMGAAGLREVAEVAALNNNYLMKRILEIRGVDAPFAQGHRRIEQVRYSWEQLARETGVGTEDLGRRAGDFGVQYWLSHHPWFVPEPVTLEPTESYTREELDEYAAILARAAQEAYENPDRVRSAPHNGPIHRINPAPLDDPDLWAMTWRAYLKKRDKWPDSDSSSTR